MPCAIGEGAGLWMQLTTNAALCRQHAADKAREIKLTIQRMEAQEERKKSIILEKERTAQMHMVRPRLFFAFFLLPLMLDRALHPDTD